mmetsp:Transcript_26401/g.55210  ORF Transcript_26401/g.55210 Transcript_26401/m.55210 type:complete len:205 (-) Transcript_26401:10-624(-)
MDQDINLAVIGCDVCGYFRNGVAIKSSISLIALDFIRNVIRSVEHGIKGVDLFDGHGRSIRENGVLVKLSLSQTHLEDLQNRRPGSYNNGSASISKGTGNGPAVSSGISNTGNESDLSFQVNSGSHVKLCVSAGGGRSLCLLKASLLHKRTSTDISGGSEGDAWRSQERNQKSKTEEHGWKFNIGFLGEMIWIMTTISWAVAKL